MEISEGENSKNTIKRTVPFDGVIAKWLILRKGIINKC